MRKLSAIVLAAACLMGVSACGGGDSTSSAGSSASASASSSPSASSSAASGARPTATAVSTSLQAPVTPSPGASAQPSSFTPTQADCAAKVLVGSEISDAALTAIVTKDATFTETKADDAALQKVSVPLKACVS